MFTETNAEKKRLGMCGGSGGAHQVDRYYEELDEGYKERTGILRIVEIPDEVVIEDVRGELVHYGLTLTKFVQQGKDDTLVDGFLRDMWMLTSPVLLAHEVDAMGGYDE